MLKKILSVSLGLFALCIVVVLGMALTQPDELRVERHTSIAAPPEVVFGFINDLHRFTEWSPWQKRDPLMTTAFEGPASGVDASYSWKGNDSVGEGRLTITESQFETKVAMRLEFLKPFEVTNQVEFSVTPAADGTRVTWAMTGKNDFTSKVMAVFIDMEQMIGKDFEAGLADLKKLAESA